MSKEKRFEVVYEDKSLKSLADSARIIRDNETGVCYLYQWSGTGGGMTLLVDRDGKPLLMDAATQG